MNSTPHITRKQFILGCMTSRVITLEEFTERYVVKRCDCHYVHCAGWTWHHRKQTSPQAIQELNR